MKHLTIDEMLDFVSLTELNSASIALSVAVNGHIRKCEKCLKTVRALQMIYDEFTRRNMKGEFKEFISENIAELKSGNTRINVKLKSETETEINANGPSIEQEELELLFENRLI